jgi:CheY-like chemotaxis protein
MTKIMLVEDDKSLREIYGVRLLAEGYDIVSAGDGEEALAMAIKERPQLIVSDVMMPKISGFDMLDILRSTTETRNIKVIMMTALSSEEQRQRGEQLGADRYLVKSQVGIEDVVRVVHEVLGDAPAPASTPTTSAPQAAQQPVAPQPNVVPAPSPRQAAPAPDNGRPHLAEPRQVESTSANPVAPSVKSRIIQPLNDPMIATIDINDLLDKELAKEAGVDVNARPAVATVDAEKELVASQLDQFQEQLPTEPANVEPSSEADDLPSVTISPDGQFTSEHTDDDPETPQPASPAVAPPVPQPVQVQAAPQAPQQAPAAPATSTMPTPISFTNTAIPSPVPSTQPIQAAPVNTPAPVASAPQSAPTPPLQPSVAVPPLPPPPSLPPLPQAPAQPQATPVATPISDQTQDAPVQPANQ